MNPRIFRVNMKNSPAELAQVLQRIDHLANQVRGVPFDPKVIVTGGVKERLPQRGLAENVPVRHRQIPRALRTMFEGNADARIARALREGFPKIDDLAEKFFRKRERWRAAAFIEGR